MKKFFGEFKKFITRGNILDLAVGVIVGGAFTAIVTSLTNNIIRPFINWIIMLISGKEGLSEVYTFLSKAYLEDGTIDLKNSNIIVKNLKVSSVKAGSNIGVVSARNSGDILADYEGIGIIEEYIDLVPILNNLYINPNIFLKDIKTVKIGNYEQ